MKIRARMISLMMVVLLCLSMLPVGAWAEETPAMNLLEGGIMLPVENVLPEEVPVEEAPAEWEELVEAEVLPLEEQPAEEELSAEEAAVEEVPALDGETVASGTCGENLTWALDDTGLLTISGTGAMEDYNYKSFPWYDYRFRIREISVEEGVTGIGNYAFYGVYFTSINLPASVTRIGNSAFDNCPCLAEVVYDGTEEQAAGIAFGWNNTALILIMDMPESASGVCGDNLTWTLANGTLTISGSGAMYDFTVGSMPTWYGLVSHIKSVVIEYGVTTIGARAFYDCTMLTDVVLPESVTSIGVNAFSGCIALDDVIVPGSVAQFGDAVFNGCIGLETAGPIGSGCNYEFGWTTEIPANAFHGCAGLSGVIIPEGITVIGSQAFNNTRLTEVVFPEGVTTIGRSAFLNCSTLTSVTFPVSLKTIESSAFSSAENLSEVNYAGTDEQWNAIDIASGNDYLYNDVLQSGTCGDNLTWTLKNGVLTIIGTGVMEVWDSYKVVPWANSTKLIKEISVSEGVTSIGRYAFQNCSSLTSIVIPESVTSIGYAAFYQCSKLTSIVIPESMTSIGGYAFYNCWSLTSVTIPDSVTSMGSYAFYRCSKLTSAGPIGGGYSIEFGWSDSIPAYAFNGCDGLTSITLPVTVTAIGGGAFGDCSALSEGHYAGTEEQWNAVSIGTGNIDLIEAIGIPLKGTCGDNLTWMFLNGVLTISGAGAMEDYDSDGAPWCNLHADIQKVSVLEGVESIGEYAFYHFSSGYSKLTGITLPESVISIGEFAFGYCSSMTSIEIPESVTSIGSHAFYKCSGLNSITLPESLTSIGSYAFYGCSKLTSAGPVGGGYSIEFGWSDSIPAYAFSNCNKLTSITLPESVSSIGEYAFSSCSGLTSITLPEGVISIGRYAFRGCDSLTSIVIPEGVTSVGDGAFSSCTALTSVAIPASVTSIGYQAFYNCSALASVSYPGTAEDWYSISFGSGNDPLITAAGFEVPTSGACGDGLAWSLTDGVLTISGTGAMTDWERSHPSWYYSRDEITSVVMENGVTSIGSNAFYGCSAMSAVTIPDSVTSMGNYAFSGCSALASINIPGSVEAIPNSAFSSCTSLTKVVINEGPTSIGNSAFSCCTSLTSITIPGTVTEIGATAFGSCTSLKSIVIPEGVETLGAMDWEGPESEAGVFADCSALTKITLPVSLKMIGVACFHNTSKLSTVVYNGEEEDWKRIHISYFNEYLLGAVDYPASGPCGENLTWEISGNTLIISGTGAMTEFTATSNPWRNYATVIKNIVLEEGVTSISEGAFTYLCEATRTTIPLSIVSIGAYAYGDRNGEGTSVTSVTYPGTDDDWMAIDIGDFNGRMWNAMGMYLGDCGKEVSWFYYDGVLTISGTGAMRDIYDASPWQEQAASITKIVVEEGVTHIGARAFSANAISDTGELIYHSVKTVYLPSTLISVGNGAFCDCRWLKQIIKADGTVIQIAAGDTNLNGETTEEDAQEILSYTSGAATTIDSENVAESVSATLASDVNLDGEVDARDATQILRYTNGLESTVG